MLAHSPRVLYVALALALASTPLSAKEAKHAAKPAAQPAAAAAPAPPPEPPQLAVFEASFSCSGKAFASPMGPEHATTATLHGAKAIGGRWVHISYDENKTAANPAPYHAGLFVGYDAGKKTFVSSCFDNMGGYCNSTSPGWNGDTLVIEGTSTMDGKQSGARDTIVKKGANQLIHTGELQGDDKKWVKVDEETCNKGK